MLCRCLWCGCWQQPWSWQRHWEPLLPLHCLPWWSVCHQQRQRWRRRWHLNIKMKKISSSHINHKMFSKLQSRSCTKWPTVVASLMLITCLVVEIIQRWMFSLADPLWPCIKVKVTEMSMSISSATCKNGLSCFLQLFRRLRPFFYVANDIYIIYIYTIILLVLLVMTW